MKLVIDQNISHRIVPLLRDSYPEIVHVRELGLQDANDYQIFMYARENAYEAVITHDDDF